MNILFPQYQAHVFFLMSIVGFALGIIYDTFKIKRKIFGSLFIFFDDFLFMIISSIVFVFSVFAFNNGILRWYEVFFLILGFIVYRITLSMLIMSLFEFIINIIQSIIMRFLRIAFIPFKHIYKLFRLLLEPIVYRYISYYKRLPLIKWINKLSPVGK